MSKTVSEERIQILKMVEDGQIDAQEAMTLLDALEILRTKGGI